MNFVEKKSAKTFPGRQNPDPHYLAALERGRILQEQLKRWRGGGITVAEVGRLLRISGKTLLASRCRHRCPTKSEDFSEKSEDYRKIRTPGISD
jgi:hypothetical protein